MKKILLFLVALVATLSMNAQTTEIHNASGKVAAYLGADVNVKFGMDGSDPTIMVYKGNALQATYTGSKYKVVSTPVEETFKAVYDTNGGANTLTFYYDAVDHGGNGITVYQDGTAHYLFDDSQFEDAKWGYNDVRDNVSKVVIDESVKKYSSLTSTAYMFKDMKNATGISGAEYLDVANVTDMSNMFYQYGSASTVLNTVPDVSGWKTDKVTNMRSLFDHYGYKSASLAVVPNVSKWNTGNVTDMSDIFGYYGYHSSSLAAFPAVSGWKTDKVTKMDRMFSTYSGYGGKQNNIECVLDLSGWNLANVTSGEKVFGFKPKTFEVTIPSKTGVKANDASHWYYGNGSKSITPPEGQSLMIGQGYAAVNAGAGITGNKVKWVQLWEGGPKFAEYNVGVTDGKAESYGGYYCWGKTTDKDSQGAYKDGTSALTGTDDTATNLWGSNWRMPTKDEFTQLLKSCNCEWTTKNNVTGLLCTGKEVPFASNSVFLPAAGEYYHGYVIEEGVNGNYWSSMPAVNSFAYGLYFNSSSQLVSGSCYRNDGYSVRAVVRGPVAVTGVSLNKTTLELGVGASETLTPTFIPADADNKNVSWTSDNESVATVDANGKVTAVAIGEATITVTTEDGNKTATCKVAVFPAGSVGTIKAKIGEKDVDVKWVQLWEGGPKFAEYNVGATSATEYGEYYAWGGSQNKVDDHNTGSSALSGDSDTATKLWGNNWRMPTKEEFQNLFANCTVQWTNVNGLNGRKFTGKDAYSSNSVFFPAAGYCSRGDVYDPGSYGYYWSSTGDSDIMYFFSGYQYVVNGRRDYGSSVRAVVKELPPSTGTAKATIGGQDVDVKWIQLWENGPKFAEKNVGASSATDEGTQMKFTNATEAWGANWCTPSKDQMDELLKAAKSAGSEKVKCEYTQEGGTYGFKFTGKETGYTSNSVFFPADGGLSDRGHAYYWSATAKDGEVWHMDLYNYGGRWSSDWASDTPMLACFVRPVLKN